MHPPCFHLHFNFNVSDLHFNLNVFHLNVFSSCNTLPLLIATQPSCFHFMNINVSTCTSIWRFSTSMVLSLVTLRLSSLLITHHTPTMKVITSQMSWFPLEHFFILSHFTIALSLLCLAVFLLCPLLCICWCHTRLHFLNIELHCFLLNSTQQCNCCTAWNLVSPKTVGESLKQCKNVFWLLKVFRLNSLQIKIKQTMKGSIQKGSTDFFTFVFG